MNDYTFTIHGQLPGLNEYIRAERANKFKAAAMKLSAEKLIIACAKWHLRGIWFTGPVIMHYCWYEPNQRRDMDNIAFAKKFVQDALVKAGVLQGDGWAQVAGFTDEFKVDSANPRVEVRIECNHVPASKA